jgi:hypothetical protein
MCPNKKKEKISASLVLLSPRLAPHLKQKIICFDARGEEVGGGPDGDDDG